MRRAWVHRPGHPKANERGIVAVDELGDWEPSRGRTLVMTDLYMDGVRAQDGTDIGSRRKRRNYMQANSVTDASDFSPDYHAKVKAERIRDYTHHRREVIGRAVYERFKP